MERKAHNRQEYSPAGRMSRTELDLSKRKQKPISAANHSEAMINQVLRRSVIGRTPNVCIVGAGISGLRCAEVLTERGIRVTILEGRDRVGGRVCYLEEFMTFVD